MNIRDIAKLAGVSASTVSKVMNGKDKDISEKTKQKVLRVIEEEQYVPYFKFLEKDGLKSRLIGLVIRQDNRGRDKIVMAVEKALRQKGYNLVVSYAEDTAGVEALAAEMIRKRVAGLLIDSTSWIPCGKLENAVVYINGTKAFDERQKAAFYYRLSEAGKLAAEELLKEGHQKIACIVRQGDTGILNGYQAAMQNSSLNIQPVWMYEGQSLEEIETYGVPQVLSENVSAIVCGSPEIACCVWKVMERSRTVIPDELSIVSVGDKEILEFSGCGISSVQLPYQELSREAVGCLADMIQGEKQIEVMRRFPPSFRKRNSIAKPAQEKQGEKIIVVGSMNMDITVEVSKIPVEGETQIANKVYTFPGGKGANQAAGVGKLGGQAYMIGRLGNDMDGKQLYASLTENHVHMDGVLFDKELPSGKAYVNVDEKGESTIVVYQGANRNLSIQQINRCKYLFQKAKYCLISMEIPEVVAEYAIKFCRRNDVEVILKPSPVVKLKKELFSDISYLVPNENELHILIPGSQTLEEKAKRLLDQGVRNVIVTRGSKGCYLKNKQDSIYFEGTGFEPVDTTGGADSFISALAVYLSEGKDLIRAVDFAIYASGISVTRHGVQPALPERKAVDIYEDEICSKYEERRRKHIGK